MSDAFGNPAVACCCLLGGYLRHNLVGCQLVRNHVPHVHSILNLPLASTHQIRHDVPCELDCLTLFNSIFFSSGRHTEQQTCNVMNCKADQCSWTLTHPPACMQAADYNLIRIVPSCCLLRLIPANAQQDHNDSLLPLPSKQHPFPRHISYTTRSYSTLSAAAASSARCWRTAA